MRPEEFEMRETLDREALERHPIWTPFRKGDRPWILGWGVPAERLDAELERYSYCGLEPLFPVLESERVPDRPDVLVAASVELAAGRRLPGYRLSPWVVGIFAAGREWVFNRGLPAQARRTALDLARALGTAPEAILPLRFRTIVPGPDGLPVEGAFDPCEESA
jgi:hypothetical protein